MSLSARVERGQMGAAFETFYRNAVQRTERAALIATDKAARKALDQTRSQMQSAGLGTLGRGIDATSDLKRKRGVHRTGGGWSASGVVFIRSKSDRTVGAIEAYTKGANILPVKGRWLWIPTDQIPLRGKDRERLTPGKWKASGLEARIGPLVMVKRKNGYPLLVVKNVGVSAAGKARSARNLKKNGLPRAGQTEVSIVAFIGIPHTARSARVDISAIMRSAQAELPSLFYQAMGRN